MNKGLIASFAFTLLCGCASQPAQETKPAGQGAPAPAAATPSAPAAAPGQPSTVLMNPLKDPNNILSKRSIYYEFDKSDIKDEYRPVVQAHGNYLAGHRGAKMLVQGNCDERGSREYNIALGQRRADGVKHMLLLMGATESQVEAVSLGEEKPRCTE